MNMTAQTSYWKNGIVGILLSPILGFFLGFVVFKATMPKNNITVSAPSIWGETLIKAMYNYEVRNFEYKYIWKIRLCMWLVFFASIALAIAYAQWSISKKRQELQATSPDEVDDFDRMVAPLEPRQWLLKSLLTFKSFATHEGQQKLIRILVDFFNFKIMLLEYLIPIAYIIILIYWIAKSIDATPELAFNKGLPGLLLCFGNFILQALSARISLENYMVTFSIQKVLRSIRNRLTGE